MSPSNEGGNKISNSIMPNPFEGKGRPRQERLLLKSKKKIEKQEEDRLVYFNNKNKNQI